MFTGIVEEKGTVQALRFNASGARIEIKANLTLKGASIGDSIAVNGCCLTIVELSEIAFAAEIVPETMKRTSLGSLKENDHVNLESPLSLNKKLGGHLVQGHVDSVGIIQNKTPLEDGSTLVFIQTPKSLLKYIVEKGSIAVDGVSLTIASVNEDGFSFAMIPHTSQHTTLGEKPLFSQVNLEADLIAKHLEKLLRSYQLDT